MKDRAQQNTSLFTLTISDASKLTMMRSYGQGTPATTSCVTTLLWLSFLNCEKDKRRSKTLHCGEDTCFVRDLGLVVNILAKAGLVPVSEHTHIAKAGLVPVSERTHTASNTIERSFTNMERTQFHVFVVRNLCTPARLFIAYAERLACASCTGGPSSPDGENSFTPLSSEGEGSSRSPGRRSAVSPSQNNMARRCGQA